MAVIFRNSAHIYILADTQFQHKLLQPPGIHERRVRHQEEEIVLLQVIISKILECMEWFEHFSRVSEADNVGAAWCCLQG